MTKFGSTASRTPGAFPYHLLSNADDHWTGNDLADSQFLCCAAAYADFVAAERKFGDYLQRARRRYPSNAVTATTLAGSSRSYLTDLTKPSHTPT